MFFFSFVVFLAQNALTCFMLIAVLPNFMSFCDSNSTRLVYSVIWFVCFHVSEVNICVLYDIPSVNEFKIFFRFQSNDIAASSNFFMGVEEGSAYTFHALITTLTNSMHCHIFHCHYITDNYDVKSSCSFTILTFIHLKYLFFYTLNNLF